MAASKPVKILEQCKVAPPPGSVAAPTSTAVPLSFFDAFWLPVLPVEIVYFYEYPHPISQFTHSLLPHLKHSLSSTLIHFYPLAGNVSWHHEPNQPMIYYTEGDSVSFTVAESDADFYHLSSNHLREAIESRPLVPHLPTSGTTIPLLAIQVTVFPNTGICIALSRHHSSCDGRAFTHFMRTWSSISKLGAGSLSPESLPFLDRTVIEDKENILNMFLELLEGLMDFESGSGNRILRAMDKDHKPNLVRATFELNEATTRRLKEWVFAQYKKAEHTQTHTRSITAPSRLVAACAYTWICLLKVEAKVGESNNNMTSFLLNTDCRARLDPPIPVTYMGNCVRPNVVIVEDKNDLIRGGVAAAAQLLGDAIHEMGKGVLKGMVQNVASLVEMSSDQIFAVVGSPQFEYYKTDFGFGRPKKVEMTSAEGARGMFLKDSSKVDGGFEFDLALNRLEMEAFASEFVDGLNALI
ncbi:malonyl-coenzyme:anthocyanin 5-O-glucoside-6'''-O-malonyltransferase-like [Macadamia integrifolia]|uniref:malonyl-coenzyme:anthocyanin 5-O-glucoside-6'''-O-malonyltransferase-like n=1 Tax=Macadamia integrifolia TaxID=60698 RepID=UPI001C531E80|nr:malonyl-coenzyme:anthocyanin 5-O-glucoside-6'''-O-malonyltransferase-like [Macadamia integrifolia]